MISIIITSFNEPKTIGKAIESFINQDIKQKYELIVAAPDKETHKIVQEYQKKNKSVKLFIDPGKGKSYALNLLLSKLKGDLFIFSDGDVFVSDNSVNEVLKKFEDKKVGCVSGQVVSLNNRKSFFGYCSHLLCDAAHRLRGKRARQGNFLECSGYLWAFRKGVVKRFPTEIAEDTIIPVFFWIKGYKVAYSPEAKVFVKFPITLKDFLKQKRRAAASHETLFRYVDVKKIPRMKSFSKEVINSYSVFFSARTFRELVYTFFLFPLRLYVWVNLFYNQKFHKRYYQDSWKRVESTK